MNNTALENPPTLPPDIDKKPLPMKPRPLITKTNRISKKLRVNKDGQVILKDDMDAFMEEFLRNGGNATQAIAKTKPELGRSEAAYMATKYMSQAKALGRIYMEQRGYGFGKLLEVALDKMKESGRTDWWDRIMKMNDYHDFTGKTSQAAPVNVNVIQTHKNLTSEYIDSEDAEIVNED